MKIKLARKNLYVILLLLMAGLLISVFLKSKSNPVAPIKPTSQAVEKSNATLSTLTSRYQNTKDSSTKDQLAQEAKDVALQRKQDMLNLIKNDPAVARKLAISAQEREKLPDQVKSLIEQDVEVQGKLTTLHSDGLTENDDRYYYYVDTQSERVALHFPGTDNELVKKTKAAINVSGLKLDRQMALSGSAAIQTVADIPNTQNIPGVKKAAVLMFNFADTPSGKAQPLTAAQARSTVFTASNSVNNFYQTSTFNKQSLTGKLQSDGDVFGWYTINTPSSNCDTDTWTPLAKTAAQNAGVDLSGYDNIIMVFPYNGICGWSGLGELMGANSWINGAVNFTNHPITHELGHNYGLMHASTEDCTGTGNQRVMISSTCTVSEYGDFYDPMGNLAFYNFNNYNKGRLGVYSASNTQTVSANGTYTILPEEQATNGVVALRIPKNNKFYYLEYRTSSDAYDSFTNIDTVDKGVGIRIGSDYSQLDYTYSLDGTLGNTTPYDRALPVGQTFTDSTLGISVKTLSVGSTGASVQITLTNPTPADTTPPTAPAGLNWKASIRSDGTPFVYLNWTESSDNVGVAIYDVYRDGVRLGGNCCSFLSNSIFVDNSAAIASTHQYYVVARDAAGNVSAASNTVTATVPSPPPSSDTTPPTISWLNPSEGQQLSGTIVDTGTCRVNAADNLSVDHVNFYLDNLLITTDTTQAYGCNFDTTTVSNGSHVLKATAYDTAGNNTSASLNVTVSNTISGTCPLTGDVNNDCHVNLTDLSMLLSNYLTANSVGDIDHSGFVNVTDLSILLSHYGQ
jgi:hypothetical protein